MRILVAEDDIALAAVVVRELRELGHAVDRAGRLAEADELCSCTEYALVILDLGLPDGDGLSLCRRLADAGDTRVLILTARAQSADRVLGLDSGASDYVTKPFDILELAARVRALLRRPATVGGSVVEAGEIRMDLAARRVWRDGVLCPLTPREFSLLECLMTRLGSAVSRTELLDQLWDMNYDGTSNVVDVHIAGLRRKLGLSGPGLQLETVRGVGYRLHA